MSQYKVRALTQALVALYVVLSSAARFGYETYPNMVLTLAALFSTLWLITRRTTWLPFLGPTVMPTGVFNVRAPKDADMMFSLQAPKDAVKCVYWGSVMDAENPYEAYGGYTNSGVADVRADGTTVIAIRRPKPYTVFGKRTPPHVHYRWVGPRGMLSGVRTVEFL